MESNDNLESLREKTQIELEALLQFDSPPETPIQFIDPKSCADFIQEKSKNIKNVVDIGDSEVDVRLSNSCFVHNREEFASQSDSKIDFSIFHHQSPITQWSLSDLNAQSIKVDDSVIVTTQLREPVEIFNLSIPDINESRYNVEPFLKLKKNKENIDAGNCNFVEKQKLGSVENNFGCVLESSILQEKRREQDFKETDNIFNGIDVDLISNVEESYFYKKECSNLLHKQCQSQVEAKFNFAKTDKTIIASWPGVRGKQNSFACSSMHSAKQQQQRILENADYNTNISKIQHNNREHIGTLDADLGDDDIENINFDYISVGPVFDLEECHTQFEINSRRLVNAVFSDDEYEVPDNPTHSANTEKSNSNSIPCSVRQLYEIVKTNHSDFAFIYALSCQLCQDRVPMECFVTLKMALLLSLASIGNNVDRSPIPIVAMGNDTYMTNYLMTNIGKLGSRFLGPVEYTKSCSNNNWIEADSILLARGGVYYAGDWRRLKVRRSETIFRNIECSRVTLEKSTASFPLETAIWTHWRSFKYGAKDQRTFNTFLKIFGIPICVSDDNHESLVDYTLEQASIRTFESTVDHLSINEDDMRSFLVCISQNDVDLSPEAALLLKNYFVTTRSVRQDCLTKQSYVVLKQFAESFAKLSLHKMVLADDAIAAIIICEHSIGNIFGSSDNGPTNFGNFSFIGSVDEYFKQFKEWLSSYLKEVSNQ